ncbi:lysozyme [Rhizobium sophoriradicis]|uniref:lysozyme n=1 Tax=Rhizobium sophoriradicis TaxID=1535245 RepID=UPI000BBD79FD|nr:lysozyme [Rhizobium sophoriradicis]PCK86338.1 lysozyme [Rhizobium sophoriradicis]
MARQVNATTEAALKQWEFFIPFVYDDADPKPGLKKTRLRPGMKIRGTATQGYGHTGPDVYPGAPDITEAQALAWLRKDLDPCERAVATSVKVDLTDNQFGALVMFTFNAGVRAFKSSTLLKKLNAGNYAAVPGELAKWNKTTIDGKKVVSNGLVNRRAAEAGLWAKGGYIQSSGTPALPQRAPLISREVTTTMTAVASGGALQFVPTNGPLAYALAAILIGAALFGLYLYIEKRRER